jgi:hypothetical protein
MRLLVSLVIILEEQERQDGGQWMGKALAGRADVEDS